MDANNQVQWHAVSIEDVLSQLETSEHGLTDADAKKRLLQFGANKLPSAKKVSIWKRWLNQFNHSLIYILLGSAFITALLTEWVDTSVILGVVLLNAMIGYWQEGKAKRAIDALKKMLEPVATVVRDGRRLTTSANNLVVGDVVLLKVGDKIPADLRLIKTHALQIDESLLTGESLPAEKHVAAALPDDTLMNRACMAYASTFVTYGSAVGVVVATGKETEVGKISEMLQSVSVLVTPLLKQVADFSKRIAIAIAMMTVALFLFGVFVRDYSFQSMFMAAVAAAVAFIPEGLPAILTITLAVGVMRMAKRHAIIRRLASVETLSSVTVICTDKTGTLTENKLTVTHIVTSDSDYSVTGSGYGDDGKITGKQDSLALQWLLKTGVLCNDAALHKVNDRWELTGNPIDGALLSLGMKADLVPAKLLLAYPKTDVIPFDSQHKFMSSLHHDHAGRSFVFVKGAPEKMLSLAQYQLVNDKKVPVDQAYWSKQINRLAEGGLRVLALAYKEVGSDQVNLTLQDIESEIVLLGVVGVIDPPRPQAKAAIQKCYQAGIQVKMITGDHPLTASIIAQHVGMPDGDCLTGDEIDQMGNQQLFDVINDVDIFARTTPAHKMRLIHALRQNGHVIAMTGDGVNDAPALKSADIGIAMGKRGTEVAKEASEIVLADDNFSSIEYAIEEARNVYHNLKKAILFVLPTSGAEGLVIVLSILMGYTLPITPLQVLWVNMVTAVTLGLALAFEPVEHQLMHEKPRNAKEPLLSKLLMWRTTFVALLFVIAMFLVFIFEMSSGETIALARTMIVNLLVLFEVFYLLNCRRIYTFSLSFSSIKSIGPALIAIVTVLLLQGVFTYLPFMQFVFDVKPMAHSQWQLIACVAMGVFFVIECEKWLLRLIQKRREKKHGSISARSTD